MREIQITDAKARLPQIIDEVERGETVVITRHGRPVARIVPETESREDKTRKIMRDIAAFRQTISPLTNDEILSARHEGHRV